MSDNINPVVESQETTAEIVSETPVTPNMSLNSTDQAWIQSLIEEKIQNNNKEEKIKREFSNFGKKLIKFLFTPAKKLDSESDTIDSLSNIAAFICTLTAYAGYLSSLLMISLMAVVVINQPALATLIMLAAVVAMAIIITVISKAIELTGLTIERTRNSMLMVSAIAFWIAFWPIAKDFLEFVIDYM